MSSTSIVVLGKQVCVQNIMLSQAKYDCDYADVKCALPMQYIPKLEGIVQTLHSVDSGT